MRKLIGALIIGGWVGLGQGFCSWNTWKEQLIDNTKVTVLETGSIAGFYDAAVGNDYSLKQGVLSHVLTNRFISGSLGWYSASEQEGVLVGGPTIKFVELFQTIFPTTAENAGILMPKFLKKLDAGWFTGWGTASGEIHYGLVLAYEFGQ